MGTPSLSAAQQELLSQLKTSLATGLTRDEASKRREKTGQFNVVDPPLKCPAWICCLLPCIKSIPSMKAFREVQPEDAEILRDGKWTRYDSAGLVVGDIVRLDEGDVVPADCVVMTLADDEMLVDVRNITGEERARSITGTNNTAPAVKLYFGGQVLQGSGTCVVTAIGSSTLLAKLIREKKFPPKENVLDGDEDEGIALV
jgi:magnesium-transporting ATPase (P-type)